MTTTSPSVARQGTSRRYGRGPDAAARSPQNLSRLLGWFSIGLGVAEALAPDTLARLIGTRPNDRSRQLLRALGAREVVTGVGILAKPHSAQWMRGRVAGDAMDMALLLNLLRATGTRRDRTAVASLAVLGVGALDLRAARALDSADGGDFQNGIQVEKSITVLRPIDDVYAFWRDFENLPRFMRHLESVTDLGDGRSRWQVRAPAGMSVEWEAVVVEDRPNEIIAWQSIEGSDVYHRGSVRFREAPGGRGTEIHVRLRYDPPAGRLGAAVAKLFHREPGQEIADDLRGFKQVMETGEVVQSDARRFP